MNASAHSTQFCNPSALNKWNEVRSLPTCLSHVSAIWTQMCSGTTPGTKQQPVSTTTVHTAAAACTQKKWFAYTISLVPWASMWEVQEDVLSFNSWLQKSLKWLAASILYLLFWYILMLWNDMKSSGQKSPKSGTSKAAFSYTNCTVIITFSDYRIPLRIFSEMGAGSSSTPKRPTAKEPPRTCQITGKSNVGSSAKSDWEEAWVLEPPLPLRPFWFEKPQ